jgi:hypothetical protein
VIDRHGPVHRLTDLFRLTYRCWPTDLRWLVCSRWLTNLCWLVCSRWLTDLCWLVHWRWLAGLRCLSYRRWQIRRRCTAGPRRLPAWRCRFDPDVLLVLNRRPHRTRPRHPGPRPAVPRRLAATRGWGSGVPAYTRLIHP